jgi:hypothetical protein
MVSSLDFSSEIPLRLPHDCAPSCRMLHDRASSPSGEGAVREGCPLFIEKFILKFRLQIPFRVFYGLPLLIQNSIKSHPPTLGGAVRGTGCPFFLRPMSFQVICQEMTNFKRSKIACKTCRHGKAIHMKAVKTSLGWRYPCRRLSCTCEDYVPPPDQLSKPGPPR